MPGARAALVRQLSNGLSVIAMRRPGLPFVSMLLGFHADPQPGDAPGARVAFDEALRWNLSAGPLDRGLLRTNQLHGDNAQVTLSTFAANLERRSICCPRRATPCTCSGPTPRSTAGSIARRCRRRPPAIRRRARFAPRCSAITPTASTRPPRRRASSPSARREAWFARVRRPANGVLVIVGDIAPGERRPGGGAGAPRLEGRRPRPAAPAARCPVAGRPRDRRGRRRAHPLHERSAAAVGLRPLRLLPAARAHATRQDRPPASRRDDARRTLRRRLRLAKGVTYGYDVDADSFRGGTAVLLGHVDVDGKATPDAIEVLRDWFDDDAHVAHHRQALRAASLEQGPPERPDERDRVAAGALAVPRLEHGLGAGGAGRLPARSRQRHAEGRRGGARRLPEERGDLRARPRKELTGRRQPRIRAQRRLQRRQQARQILRRERLDAVAIESRLA